MWKAENLKIRLFGPFWPKSRLFRQKEDQFRSIFSKRSDIRPRSDKGDLLGDLGDLEEAVGGDVVPHEVEAVGGGEGAAHGWCPAPGPGRSPVLRPVGAYGPAFSPA